MHYRRLPSAMDAGKRRKGGPFPIPAFWKLITYILFTFDDLGGVGGGVKIIYSFPSNFK